MYGKSKNPIKEYLGIDDKVPVKVGKIRHPAVKIK